MTPITNSLDRLFHNSEVVSVTFLEMEESRNVINENMEQFVDNLKVNNSDEVDDEINTIIGGE
ncbi:hypothetical protein [Winogradskyella bathintestinalis]|uniref:Uncharacterized protein n=1 Tax=Winogradskyella bathintestinalis TaxID=3035208 RepID=A0ABT7ZQJ7_9FLAO|nr:hypothetical protein [Winogradskyella bathintestinalis]MDN3491279.1 hypothetical protein [Winogradskyella bathintestinalis]